MRKGPRGYGAMFLIIMGIVYTLLVFAVYVAYHLAN